MRLCRKFSTCLMPIAFPFHYLTSSLPFLFIASPPHCFLLVILLFTTPTLYHFPCLLSSMPFLLSTILPLCFSNSTLFLLCFSFTFPYFLITYTPLHLSSLPSLFFTLPFLFLSLSLPLVFLLVNIHHFWFVLFQVVEDGYEFFAKRQLVTLFSAPNYCGEFDNAGGMMSVDETLMCSFQVGARDLTRCCMILNICCVILNIWEFLNWTKS